MNEKYSQTNEQQKGSIAMLCVTTDVTQVASGFDGGHKHLSFTPFTHQFKCIW